MKRKKTCLSDKLKKGNFHNPPIDDVSRYSSLWLMLFTLARPHLPAKSLIINPFADGELILQQAHLLNLPTLSYGFSTFPFTLPHIHNDILLYPPEKIPNLHF